MSRDGLRWSRKFVGLLIEQQRREAERKGKRLKVARFESVGEILGSRKYQDHLEEMWRKN